MKEEDKEKVELSHEPVPGYPVAYYIVVGIALAYLVIVFGTSP